MQTNRDIRLDMIRSTALLLIVLLHAWTMLHLNTPAQGWLNNLYESLTPCGTALFTMVSGALLLNAPLCSYRMFFRKRLSRVLIPFLLWALVVYVISCLMHKYPEIGNWKTALRLFFPYLIAQKINGQHWFVHMILALYLITPLLQRALQASTRRQVAGLLIGWVLVLILRQYCPDIYMLHYVGRLFYWIGLYVAGYFFIHYPLPAMKKKWRCWMWGGWLALYTVDVLTQSSIQAVRPLLAVLLFVCLYQSPVKGEELCVRLSRYSYTVYLMHIPVLGVCLLPIAKTLPHLPHACQALMPLVAAVVVVGICTALCAVADRCRYINNRVIGISR